MSHKVFPHTSPHSSLRPHTAASLMVRAGGVELYTSRESMTEEGSGLAGQGTAGIFVQDL